MHGGAIKFECVTEIILDQNRRDIVFLSRKAEGVSTQTESGKDVGDEFESSIGVKSASGRRKCSRSCMVQQSSNSSLYFRWCP
jgi:hypothetical protein